MVPTHMFLTRGVGVHKEKLTSFEEALRSAGIAYCNLVSVSSIFPPDCKIIPRKRGEKLLNPGEITFCVMARSETNERNRLISASIGLAIPTGRKCNYGYLSEHHGHGETDEEAGEYTEDLAAQMLATTLGIDFDPNVAWKEREQVFKMGGEIVRTQNITQSAIGKPNMWTTVVACAVFIPLENIKEEKSSGKRRKSK
ncbi:MAG: arginine decarboxylase, pyruvoyl-dependent [Nitrospira sp.]|nr:arginine decarboxylase, pyruvoyl-dependent [Nitrospira sp.]MCB9710161.1 arginine decarboxylase, pyruvoyl-dependent [Nitrospiraceae bacterium]MDR4486701.1 arginine decarboxylase, pyruvoyl-dependent [Nitrospirales bacterium]MCA9469192.1 arginine decarboxylase, pyruvoyl-dependent [Nitrospira sp.]MCA9474680.1 arginine decarboxylase, pyruvoyl-dependent [Nitrospira sp.]